MRKNLLFFFSYFPCRDDLEIDPTHSSFFCVVKREKEQKKRERQRINNGESEQQKNVIIKEGERERGEEKN